MSVRKAYDPIDIQAAPKGAWPEVIPPLTEREARAAAKRLWRFAMGDDPCPGIEVTSGNRYTWTRWVRHNGYSERVLFVNPSKGWREFVHDLSHLFVTLANPRERPHSKFHARFEAKLVREVVKRGWLDGKLKPEAKPVIEPAKPTLDDKRRKTLDQIEAGIARWEVKRKRAERFLAKLRRRQRYYSKVVSL